MADNLPLVSCICPTYGRPPKRQSLLEEAIYSFLQQDYNRTELIILNDCYGQELVCDVPNVIVINVPRRFHSLGEKYNAAIAMANGSLICPWEDDDLSLFWRISMSVERIGDRGYWSPKKYWFLDKRGLHYKKISGVGHNCSIFRRELYDKVGGYRHISGPQDRYIDNAFQQAEKLVIGNRLNLDEYFYIYRWGVSPTHLSGARNSNKFWADVGKKGATPGCYVLKPQWERDYFAMTRKVIAETIPEQPKQEQPILEVRLESKSSEPGSIKTNTDLRIFSLSHDWNVLDKVPNYDFVTKVLLGDLEVGQYQTNKIGEGRAFLYDLDPGNATYIGFLNGRLANKYKWRSKLSYEILLDRLKGKLKPDNVIMAWPAEATWARFSEKMHKKITPLLEELAGFTGARLYTGQITFWANDFICHRSVWFDWRAFWRKCFHYFYAKYGLNFPFPTYNVDMKRKPAYFLERITCLYFANRLDLNIIEL